MECSKINLHQGNIEIYMKYGIFEYGIYQEYPKNRFSMQNCVFCGEYKLWHIPKKTCNIKNLEFSGVWNIQKNLETKKNLSDLEYRNIPKKYINNRNIENLGIWNIPGIFQKM